MSCSSTALHIKGTDQLLQQSGYHVVFAWRTAFSACDGRTVTCILVNTAGNLKPQ